MGLPGHRGRLDGHLHYHETRSGASREDPNLVPQGQRQRLATRRHRPRDDRDVSGGGAADAPPAQAASRGSRPARSSHPRGHPTRPTSASSPPPSPPTSPRPTGSPPRARPAGSTPTSHRPLRSQYGRCPRPRTTPRRKAAGGRSSQPRGRPAAGLRRQPHRGRASARRRTSRSATCPRQLRRPGGALTMPIIAPGDTVRLQQSSTSPSSTFPTHAGRSPTSPLCQRQPRPHQGLASTPARAMRSPPPSPMSTRPSRPLTRG